jgi:hypothetical protein
VLLIASAGAPAALSAPKQSPRTLHLTALVTKVRSSQSGDATEESANITLQSGSKKVGSLGFRECSGEAISFLDCEGKGTPSGLGSGLDVRATWKCSVTGTGCCASVSEGFFLGKTGSPVATLRI